MRSAKTAANTSTDRMVIGTSGRPSMRTPGIRSAIGSDATGLGLGAGLTLIADPRVDDGVEEIDHQVDDHDHGAREQHGGLHDREVAEGDALVEQPADARPGEDG